MARLIWQTGRIPRFLIKSGVFDGRIVGRIMRGAGQLPVYRASDQAADSLRDAEQPRCDRGECVIIYPEGTITRDPDYWPMPAKTGVARLALACPDVPVIPIGQWGAHRTLGRRRPVPPDPPPAARGLARPAVRPQPLPRPASRPPRLLRELTDDDHGRGHGQVEQSDASRRPGDRRTLERDAARTRPHDQLHGRIRARAAAAAGRPAATRSPLGLCPPAAAAPWSGRPSPRPARRRSRSPSARHRPVPRAASSSSTPSARMSEVHMIAVRSGPRPAAPGPGRPLLARVRSAAR